MLHDGNSLDETTVSDEDKDEIQYISGGIVFLYYLFLGIEH